MIYGVICVRFPCMKNEVVIEIGDGRCSGLPQFSKLTISEKFWGRPNTLILSSTILLPAIADNGVCNLDGL